MRDVWIERHEAPIFPFRATFSPTRAKIRTVLQSTLGQNGDHDQEPISISHTAQPTQ